MKKVIICAIIALAGFSLLQSCHKVDKITPSPLDTTIPTAPVQGPPGAAGSVTGTPPASAIFGKDYSGRAKYSTVTSKSPCKTAKDCTFTKYSNAPRTSAECTCQAPCEPFVVNNAQANARKESNERLCGPKDWFGPNCPALPCNFIEYDQFKCVDGMCVGIDLDGE